MKFSAAASFLVAAAAACSLVSAKNEGTASASRRARTRGVVQPEVQPEVLLELEPEVQPEAQLELQPEDVAAVPIVMHTAAHLQAQSRIVGGTAVPNVATYPWFVQGRGCAGTLIARDMVLTAAHCEGFPFDSAVLLNSLTAYDDIRFGRASKPSGAQEPSVARFSNGARIQVPHPDYSPGSEANDYMLVKLQGAVPNAQLVELNFDDNFPVPNQSLRVIGVGTTAANGPVSDFLLQVDVNYVSNNQCNNLYGQGSIQGDVMLCAAVPNGGKDSCQGDSGGPLFDEASRKQVGVVSWGVGCADRRYPGVYARLSGAEQWIKSVVCGNSAASSEFKPDFCNPNPAPPAPATSAPAPPAPATSAPAPPAPVTPAPAPPAPAPPAPAPPSTARSFEVEVIVLHDTYPGETGWTLKDSSGKVVLSQGIGTYNTPRGRVSRKVSVPDGLYEFEMLDSQGDGLCCRYGRGAYGVRINGGSLVVSGSQFGSSKAETFLVGNPDSVDYVVAIQYDLYPEETSWSLEDANGNFIAGVGAKQVFQDFAYFQFTLDGGLTPGADYVFRLADDFGDGFCCGNSGDGFIGLFAIINGALTKQLGGGAAQFQFNANAPFTVPADLAIRQRSGFGTEKQVKFQNSLELPSMKASKSKVVVVKSCSDSLDVTFEVNDAIGSQTCAWLLPNMDQFEYLCQFEDVASICPSTCGLCGLDAP
jgi:trypsin